MKKKTQVINEVMGEIKFDYNWKRKVVYGLFLLSIIIVSCKKTEESPPLESSIKNYLHLSHTRTNNDPQLDSVTETINYKKFDVLMLGGDLAYLSSENNSTMQRIDSVFDVGNPNTLWALGNHDYTDLNRIQEFTNRPPYYATYKNGITFIVLDTQDSSSNIIGSQKKYLQKVLDTIIESSHLILLHHKLIWMDNHSELETQISSVSNGPAGECSYCINPNNFNSEIYPELVKVKLKGVKVICIGGDIGFKTDEFEYFTTDEIHFLASGINFNNSSNKALFFTHDLKNKSLNWEYKFLSDL
ncbi:MAG: hypothetical protein CMD35_04685 [Flavobacteriales bacterium]|nr:hypothetical protein [Flavobacteriales bacterium]